MKILLMGATGVPGRAVAAVLAPGHELLQASRHSAAYRADLGDEQSLRHLFDRHGPFDAVVCTAGEAAFARLDTMTMERFAAGLGDKLLGQVRLTLLARTCLSHGGSITLTTGVLTRMPIPGGTNAATANAAIEGFVKAAAVDMPRGLRINAVSPTVLCESWAAYGPAFPGVEPVPAARAALAYLRSVEGAETGRIYTVH